MRKLTILEKMKYRKLAKEKARLEQDLVVLNALCAYRDGLVTKAVWTDTDEHAEYIVVIEEIGKILRRIPRVG